MSLVECMIATAICGCLLTAVAAAFRTSLEAVQINDHFTRATQSSRVAMDHLLDEIRRAGSVQVSPDGTRLDVIRADSVRAADEVYRGYRFDPAGKLTLQVFYKNGTSSPLYTLATNVESATFGPVETAPSSTVVVRVPVSLKVVVGKSQFTLDGAAAPRQAVTY